MAKRWRVTDEQLRRNAKPAELEAHAVAARWFIGGSSVFTVITALAALDMYFGNPTAINGVIGAGFGSAVWWAVTIHGVTQRRRYDRPAEPMTARVTLAQACKIAEVKPGTIRQWVA